MSKNQKNSVKIATLPPEASSHLINSKALIWLALSMGTTSTLLPKQAIALATDQVGVNNSDNAISNLLEASVEKKSPQPPAIDLVKEAKSLKKAKLNETLPTPPRIPEATENIPAKTAKLSETSPSFFLEKKPKSLPNLRITHNRPSRLDNLLTKLEKPAKKSVSHNPNTPRNLLAQAKTQSSPQLVHLVVPGDTVNEIATRYQVSPEALVKKNKITNPELIHVNQKLVIPRIDKTPKNNPVALKTETSRIEIRKSDNQHIAQLRADILKLREEYQREKNHAPESFAAETREDKPSGQPLPQLAKLKNDLVKLRRDYAVETLSPTSQNTPVVMANVQTAEASYPSSQDIPEQKISFSKPNIPELPPLPDAEEYLPEAPAESKVFDGYIWPAQGVFTSGYGWRWGRMHQGIDIAAPIGTPIYAAASGEVIYAGWSSSGYGNLVKVKHYNGSITLYAHNNRVLVRRGQKVTQGEHIADMGSTGFSTGPHLHFEIHPYQQGPVNPLAYLP